MKTQKVLFHEDKYVDGKLTYKKGEKYDLPVETGTVERWLKRGATIVEDESPVVEPPKEKEISEDEALQALGGEEEVVNESVKKENKRANKPNKG